MTHSTVLSPAQRPTRKSPTVIPQLAWRDERYGVGPYAWLSPGLNSSTAYVRLSRGLACVFLTASHGPLSHQQVGHLGFAEHQLWNAIGSHLAGLADASSDAFWVRAPHPSLGRAPGQLPPGVEVQARGRTAAGWLAHPQSFQRLHHHLVATLRPRHELTYYVGDNDTLFAFDATAREVAQTLGWERLMRYSLGFPLLAVPPRAPLRFS